MLDDAVRLVVDRDEPNESNFVRQHAQVDLAAHGDHRRATTRIFGSKPGSYGAGVLPFIEAGNRRSDHDLAEVYTAWGGFAHGRDLDGVPARDDMEANYRRIAVATRMSIPRSMTSPIGRLLPISRRNGGNGSSRLTGVDPKAYVGRLDNAGCNPHAIADRGDGAGLPSSGDQSAMDRGNAATRLQGGLRAGGDRRLPVRLRAPRVW